MLILKFLSENRTEKVGCLAEHGLSIYIQTEELCLLFDLGQSDIFEKNAKIVKADLDQVDAVVISHGHFDHTNGIPRFCLLNTHAPIYLQKDSFGRRYQLTDGKPKGEDIGILWEKDHPELKNRLIMTDGPIYLTSHIAISGTMDQDPAFVPTEQFVILRDTDQYDKETMSHEQILVISQPEGLYIFSGCSHLGVIAAIRQAQKLFPGEKIAGLIAGMHLYKTPDAIRNSLIEKILSYNLDLIIPLHCTGMDAICQIKSKMGSECLNAGSGDIIDCQLRQRLSSTV